MTALAFKPATRKQTKARIAIMGPSGSGKTLWALRIAAGLGKRIAVIDTENRSASLYKGDYDLDFDVLEIDPEDDGGFDPRKYVDAIRLAERERYDVVIVDSLSHAWAGTGGALEMVDNSNSKNSFAAWKDVTPIQNALTDALTHCKIHLIATLRSKTEYVLEEQIDGKGRKRQVPVRKALAPVQRAGLEYEFSIFAECELEGHAFKISKTRARFCDGKTYGIGQVDSFARALHEFHETGEAAAKPASVPPPRLVPAEDPKHAERFNLYWFPKTKHSGKPIQELELQSLHNYIERLTKGLSDDKWAEIIQPYLEAAQHELVERLLREQEASDAAAAKELAEAGMKSDAEQAQYTTSA